MKKLIISILIPSLLLSLCGCYSMKEISKYDYIKPDSNKETFLITNDGTRYQIFKLSYNVTRDTINILEGTKSIKSVWKWAKWITKETILPFTGRIAFADVKNFEVETKDESKTTFLITIGVIVGVVFIILYVAANESFEYGSIY